MKALSDEEYEEIIDKVLNTPDINNLKTTKRRIVGVTRLPDHILNWLVLVNRSAGTEDLYHEEIVLLAGLEVERRQNEKAQTEKV